MHTEKIILLVYELCIIQNLCYSACLIYAINVAYKCIHLPSAFPPPCHLPWTGGRAPLNSLWVPVGFFRSPLVASWAPPGYLLGSPGSLWLPLASFCTPLGSPWVLFGCPLAPLGLHLVSLGFHRGACGTSFGWYLGSDLGHCGFDFGVLLGSF